MSINVIRRDALDNKNESIKANSLGSQCQRVANVALPFLAMYKPFGFSVGVGSGAMRVLANVSNLTTAVKNGDKKDITFQVIQTAIAVASIASTLIAHPIGMLITTVNDVALDAFHMVKFIQAGDYQKAAEKGFSILSNAVYLGVMLGGGIELSIASIALQILNGIYQSRTEFIKGNYLEAFGHVAMVGIRCHQMAGRMHTLQSKWKFEAFLRELTEKQKALEPKSTKKILCCVQIANNLNSKQEPQKSSNIDSNKLQNLNFEITQEQFIREFKALLINGKEADFDKLFQKGNQFINTELYLSYGRSSVTGTPLCCAMHNSSINRFASMNCIKSLMKHGARVDVIEFFHWNYRDVPLHIIHETILLGLQHGLIDPNINNGQLFWLVYDKFRDSWKQITDVMFDFGFDIHANKTLAEIAIHERYDITKFSKLTDYLIDKGANFNQDAPELLKISLYWDSSFSKYLVSKGADVKYIDQRTGSSLIQIAAIQGKLDLIQLFLNKGADLWHIDNLGQSTLHYAAKADNTNTNLINYLLLKGFDINQSAKNGETALYFAAEYGRYINAKYLLEKGAKSNTTPSPLEIAILKNFQSIVQLLLVSQ
jgi:hypothetical protein